MTTAVCTSLHYLKQNTKYNPILESVLQLKPTKEKDKNLLKLKPNLLPYTLIHIIHIYIHIFLFKYVIYNYECERINTRKHIDKKK